MNSTLKIEKEQVQGKVLVTVFYLHGWLDSQGEETLLAAAKDSYDAGSRYLVLNLKDVEMLTSAGMRAMQKVHKIYRQEGEQVTVSHVKLCNAPEQVHNVLGITGFLMTIPNYENQQTAIDAFEK